MQSGGNNNQLTTSNTRVLGTFSNPNIGLGLFRNTGIGHSCARRGDLRRPGQFVKSNTEETQTSSIEVQYNQDSQDNINNRNNLGSTQQDIHTGNQQNNQIIANNLGSGQQDLYPGTQQNNQMLATRARGRSNYPQLNTGGISSRGARGIGGSTVRGGGRGRGVIEIRDGDWTCMDCGENNFHFREVCYGCGSSWKCIHCNRMNNAMHTDCQDCCEPRYPIDPQMYQSNNHHLAHSHNQRGRGRAVGQYMANTYNQRGNSVRGFNYRGRGSNRGGQIDLETFKGEVLTKLESAIEVGHINSEKLDQLTIL